MKLAFYDVKAARSSTNGRFFDRLIEFDQYSLLGLGDAARYVHTELVFDEPWRQFDPHPIQTGDGAQKGMLCYSSSARDGGVRFKYINLADSKWTLVDLGMLNRADLGLALRFCEQHIGLKYDWLGIFGFVFPLGEHDDHDRFCDEACIEVMQYPPVLRNIPSKIAKNVVPLIRWRTNPAELFITLSK